MGQAILNIKSEHLSIFVFSANANFAFTKSKIKNKTLHTQADYYFSSGSMSLFDFEKDQAVVLNNYKSVWPVFFENTVYNIEIEFDEKYPPDNHIDPYIKHELKEIVNQFNYRSSRLNGTLNFGNDIGKFQLNIVYSLNNKLQNFIFEFEVFPIKLDYKSDYPKLIESIQKAYPLLVLDFLKKTFSGSSIGQLNHPFVWWHIFQQLYTHLLHEANLIISKPHNRLLKSISYLRREKLVYLTPQLEEEFAEQRKNENHYYQVSKKELSVDTPENRFIKYALGNIFFQYQRVFSFITEKYKSTISQQTIVEYNHQRKQLNNLKNHNFWRSVGDFTGFKQESLTIQKRVGYSGFYRNYLLLMQGVKFMGENRKLEYKNIAELYQIWCFIQIKNMIEEITGVRPESSFEDKFEKKKWNDIRISELFSCFTFELSNGDRIELLHDYSYKNSESDNKNNLRSFTEEQRPDITLRMYKKDIPEGAMHTYLFDAKYRIKTFSNDEYISDDAPPPDTLNQMHRYRDSLFFKSKNYFDQAEKGVIGGYILFPGELDDNKAKETQYYKSINEVNIGAFPLNLNYNQNNNLLRTFLKEKVLQIDSNEILKNTIAQKYIIPNFPEGQVMIGKARGEQETYLSNNPLIFHTPISNKDLKKFKGIKYFSHWTKEGECKNYHRVKAIHFCKRSELKNKFNYPFHKNSDQLYLVLELFDKKYHLEKPIKSTRGHHFLRYADIMKFLSATTFEEFENQ